MDDRLNKMEIFISENFVTFPSDRIKQYAAQGMTVYVPSVYDIPEAFDNVITQVQTLTDAPMQFVDGSVVYWNPLLPIKYLGRTGTIVYSVVLTEDLAGREPTYEPLNPSQFKTKTIPTLVEWATQTRPKTIRIPLDSADVPLLQTATSYKFCPVNGTPVSLIALDVLRAITILGRTGKAVEYSIGVNDDTLGKIMVWLKEDKMRKLTILGMKSCISDVSADLVYLKRLQEIRMYIGHTVSLISLLKEFKPLIGQYMTIIRLVSLMSISDTGYDVKRLQCMGDTYSMTNVGVVPINAKLENDNSKKWTRPCQDTNDYILSGSYGSRKRFAGYVNYFY
jgi:hypothetical protein